MSREAELRILEAVKTAERQGFGVEVRGKKIKVSAPGADHGITLSASMHEGRALANALAALRRLGVHFDNSNGNGNGSKRAEPEPDVVITDPSIKVQDVVRVSGKDLVSFPGDWRSLSVQERAREVWQAARMHCGRTDARHRTMYGTTYWAYTGPLSDFMHAIFPTMPYDPEDGEHGTQGAKAVYDFLKANKNIVTTKVGNQYVQLVRDEFSEVTVTTKPTEAQTKGRRGGEEGEYPCDFPECADRAPYKFARYLGAHKSRHHGVPGTSDRAASRRRTRADQPVVDLTTPDAVALSPSEPVGNPMEEVDAALALVREMIADALHRRRDPAQMTDLDRVEELHRLADGLDAPAVIAAIRAQEGSAPGYVQHLLAVSRFATEVTQGLVAVV